MISIVTCHLIVISRPYTVVLGADALSGDEPTKQQFSAIRSIPHPNYDGHRNDIMLLKVRMVFHCLFYGYACCL